MSSLGRAQIFCRPLAPQDWIPWHEPMSQRGPWHYLLHSKSLQSISYLVYALEYMSMGTCILTNFYQTNLFWNYQWQMAAQQREGCNGGNAHRDKLLVAVMGNFCFYCFVFLPIATHCFIANLSFVTAEQHLHCLWQPSGLLKPISSWELGAVVLSALMSDLCNSR